jgi:hypothetical protein
MGLWGDVASGTVLAQHVLNEGKTHAKEVSNATWRAEMPLVGTQDFLTSIDRIGSHAKKPTMSLAYDQVKTALMLVPRRGEEAEGAMTTGDGAQKNQKKRKRFGVEAPQFCGTTNNRTITSRRRLTSLIH